MKIRHLILVAIAVLGFTACGGDSAPKGIVESLYSALQKGDYAKAAKIELENTEEEYLPAMPSKEAKDWAVQYIAEEMRKYATEKEYHGVKSFKITDTKWTHENIRITFIVTVITNNGEESTDHVWFQKKDGKWWLDSDSSMNWRDH